MVCLRCLVCSLVCVTLVVVAPTPVLPTILVTLLRACAEMLRTRATVSTSHWTALLAVVKDRLVVLHIGAHSIHGLSLLRSLMCHHWCRRTTRAWVTVNTRHWLRSRWRHELRVATRIHHLRARNHPLRPGHELLRHHHRTAHLALLRCHVLVVVGEVAVLVHLRGARPHENSLVVWYLR